MLPGNALLWEGAALQAPGPQEPPGTVCHKGKLLGN